MTPFGHIHIERAPPPPEVGVFNEQNINEKNPLEHVKTSVQHYNVFFIESPQSPTRHQAARLSPRRTCG
jgi:hypothetical protein